MFPHLEKHLETPLILKMNQWSEASSSPEMAEDREPSSVLRQIFHAQNHNDFF